MKSHRMQRSWMISLAVHVCLAVIFTYMTINPEYSDKNDAINVSILRVARPSVIPRAPIENLVIVPMPVPDFQVTPQSESISQRSVRGQQVKSTVRSVPASTLATRGMVSLQRRQVSVNVSSPFHQRFTEPLTTATDLPIESNQPLVAGLSGGSIADGISGESRIGLGNGRGRSALGSGADIGQGRIRNRVGLTSLVEGAGTANIDESLAGVTDNIALGNSVPELPEGTPGAIIQGRGREIVGQLNLVRFDDPLHPNADI